MTSAKTAALISLSIAKELKAKPTISNFHGLKPQIISTTTISKTTLASISLRLWTEKGNGKKYEYNK